MTFMQLITFVLHIGAALLMGVAIGMERQFRQHPAGLRTNALVCVGAALFVSLSGMLDHEASPSRMAAAVVSGIGFLAGGVILREGMTVKGMNTAATLWCSAAVGSLAGAGFPLQGLRGTAAVLLLHATLRPVSRWVDRGMKTATDIEMYYQMRRRVPIGSGGHYPRDSHAARQLPSLDDSPGESRPQTTTGPTGHVIADIYSLVRNDRAMEDLMLRINLESSVISVSWAKVR